VEGRTSFKDTLSHACSGQVLKSFTQISLHYICFDRQSKALLRLQCFCRSTRATRIINNSVATRSLKPSRNPSALSWRWMDRKRWAHAGVPE